MRAAVIAKRLLVLLPISFLLIGGNSLAQAQQAGEGQVAASNLTLPAGTSQLSSDTLLNPEARMWEQFPVRRVLLNRTPPLYDTAPSAEFEIGEVSVRMVRAGGKLLVHLAWQDSTKDSVSLPALPETPPEERFRKVQTVAPGKFHDACSVMVPAGRSNGAFTPSLQMGAAGQPVTLYYWNATRGAAVLEAEGRGTTSQTEQSLRAQGSHRNGTWRVTLELPELAAGVPVALAVWNGSQQDRDGRKYFSVWHWLE